MMTVHAPEQLVKHLTLAGLAREQESGTMSQDIIATGVLHMSQSLRTGKLTSAVFPAT
jgi:hypothetical protein